MSLNPTTLAAVSQPASDPAVSPTTREDEDQDEEDHDLGEYRLPEGLYQGPEPVAHEGEPERPSHAPEKRIVTLRGEQLVPGKDEAEQEDRPPDGKRPTRRDDQ